MQRAPPLWVLLDCREVWRRGWPTYPAIILIQVAACIFVVVRVGVVEMYYC